MENEHHYNRRTMVIVLPLDLLLSHLENILAV